MQEGMSPMLSPYGQHRASLWGIPGCPQAWSAPRGIALPISREFRLVSPFVSLAYFPRLVRSNSGNEECFNQRSARSGCNFPVLIKWSNKINSLHGAAVAARRGCFGA